MKTNAKVDNKYLIVLKGTSCSGKSTFSKKILDYADFELLSSDDIAENIFGLKNQPNTREVFEYLNDKLLRDIKEEKNIIIDATTLLARYDKFYSKAAAKKDYIKVCVCFDLDNESLEHNIQKRHKEKWSHMDIEKIRDIVNRQKKSFTLPDYTYYDKIYYIKCNDDFQSVLGEFYEDIL